MKRSILLVGLAGWLTGVQRAAGQTTGERTAPAAAHGVAAQTTAATSTFANPGKDYGSAPLWVWNTKVTRGLIDTCLRAFKDHGFGGVFVHPRAGLVTEYLSPDWFGLWAY